MSFTKEDIEQIEQKGITLNQVKDQMDLFRSGIPFVNLVKAANISSGILSLTETQKMMYIDLFDNLKDEVDITKFVPASGAATRMFKFLFQFSENYIPKVESIDSYINRKNDKDLSIFFNNIDQFPFYIDVVKQISSTFDNYEKLSTDEKQRLFVTTMLSEDKLNFSSLPKGLFPFHKYKDHISTAFEEHIVEAALYASSKGKSKLHFTITNKHNESFKLEYKRIKRLVEEKTKTNFNITFSYQKESTDTIAVDPNNNPFRNSDGTLLFRPSGHGALIENLNALNTDIVFIKNIDNVVVIKYQEEVALNKKLLAGILLDLQNKAFNAINLLENNSIPKTEILSISKFLQEELNVVIPQEFYSFSQKLQVEYLIDKLNRPIRVCGMVKNEGEPGGGPFWVRNERGEVSLQIVESAQIDMQNEDQKSIMNNATHFNPVDLVCGLKNYKGEKFNLKEFVDDNTSFISSKTQSGKSLKALELPGLWNGGMAFWNTVFVEVPLITFNPVKTVNDLLKPTHQFEE